MAGRPVHGKIRAAGKTPHSTDDLPNRRTPSSSAIQVKRGRSWPERSAILASHRQFRLEPVVTEQFHRMRRSDCAIAATQGLCRTILVAAPASAFGRLRFRGSLPTRELRATVVPVPASEFMSGQRAPAWRRAPRRRNASRFVRGIPHSTGVGFESHVPAILLFRFRERTSRMA